MKNFISAGIRATETAAAARVSGTLYLLGTDNVPAVALNDAAIGEEVVYATNGKGGIYEFTVAAAAATTDLGDPAYWDESAGEVTDTTDTGANEKIGVFWDTAGHVRLD